METLRGILLMTAAMAGFALEDMLIKHASGELPVAQVMAVLGTGGSIAFALLARRHGSPLWSRDLLSRPVFLRNASEMLGTLCFVTALALTPLSSTIAILQITPLMVTLGAWMFLGAEVGWRRWSAIAIGLGGVLMIIRPGMEGFLPASLLAVMAAIALAMRDLATRTTPRRITSMQLSAWGFASIVPLSAVLLIFVTPPQPVSLSLGLTLSAALVIGVGSYYAIVEAMRLGDVAVVTPFRYSRLIFALVISVLVFGEHPDSWTLLGAAIVIASGLYSIAREHRARKRPFLSSATALERR